MYTVPTYNILLLGPVQTGKSAFLECCKQYADPSYAIEKSIGHGNQSHTKDVHVEVITTSLPIHKLYDLDDNRQVDATRLRDERSLKAFLARDDNLDLRRRGSWLVLEAISNLRHSRSRRSQWI